MQKVNVEGNEQGFNSTVETNNKVKNAEHVYTAVNEKSAKMN